MNEDPHDGLEPVPGLRTCTLCGTRGADRLALDLYYGFKTKQVMDTPYTKTTRLVAMLAGKEVLSFCPACVDLERRRRQASVSLQIGLSLASLVLCVLILAVFLMDADVDEPTPGAALLAFFGALASLMIFFAGLARRSVKLDRVLVIAFRRHASSLPLREKVKRRMNAPVGKNDPFDPRSRDIGFDIERADTYSTLHFWTAAEYTDVFKGEALSRELNPDGTGQA